MGNDLEVRALKSLDELALHAAEIDALNARSWRPCPFSTFAYLRNACEHPERFADAEHRQLLVLAAYRRGRLIGLLPLVRQRSEFLGVAFARIELLLSHDADRPHVVAEAADREACALAFYEYLLTREPSWEALDVTDQEEESDLYPPPALLGRGFFVRRIPGVANATIHLEWPNTASYFESLPRKFRANVARGARRLMAAGAVEYVVSEACETTPRLLELYLELEQRSWKEATGRTLGRDAARLAFYRGLLAREQALRVGVALTVLNGVPIAGSLHGVFGCVVYVLQLCFDEAYARLAPGQLALLMLVRMAIERGFTEVNLLQGTTEHKERWLAEVRPTYRIQAYRVGSAPYARVKLMELGWRLLGGAGVACDIRRADIRGLQRTTRRSEANLDSARARYQRLLAAGLPLERCDAAALGSTLAFTVARARHLPASSNHHASITRSTAISALMPRLASVATATAPQSAVTIFDADSPPALAFTRSLGRAGVPVHIFGPARFAVARYSRYASDFAPCPEPSDAEAFLPWLRARVRTGEIGLIAPTSDQIAYYLAELYGELPPEFREAIPARTAALSYLFKDRFHDACVAADVATPRSLCPASASAAVDAARALSYPVILKPKTHVGIGGFRGVVVDDAAELLRRFRPYVVGKAGRGIVAEYPELRWPLLQEYIPDALENLYSVSGVIGRRGEVLAQAATRKTAQWPPLLGVGTLFVGCEEPRVLAAGTRAARALGVRGMFEIELIYDRRHDQYLAIDLNARAYGQIALDIARGNDLPWLWYRLASGQDVAPLGVATNHARWVHSIPLHIGNWVGLIRGPERRSRLESYLRMLEADARSVDIVNDAADPVPSILYTAKMLRHASGLIRPFLAENPKA